jgi:hypothetical protein
MLITYHFLMPSMKNNNISYLTIFGTGLLTAIITGLGTYPIASVFASVDQSALEPVDLHLEECIKELQAGNTEGALNHCELADQELDPLLGNTTG